MNIEKTEQETIMAFLIGAGCYLEDYFYDLRLYQSPKIGQYYVTLRRYKGNEELASHYLMVYSRLYNEANMARLYTTTYGGQWHSGSEYGLTYQLSLGSPSQFKLMVEKAFPQAKFVWFSDAIT